MNSPPFSLTSPPNVIVLGDFNIHMDNMNHIFTTFLDSFGFQQHINFPIHSKGRICDLMCCSGISLFNCSSTDLPISDHMFMSFNLNLTISKTKTSQIICFHNIKDINLTTLTMGIETLSMPMVSISFPSTTNQFPHYNDNRLHTLLNSLAPIKTQTVSFTHSAPWFTPQLCLLKAKSTHSSLISGSVPSSLKSAAVTLIIKKPGSDPNTFNNIRPISNLAFLSKILGKTDASQVYSDLYNNNFTNSSSLVSVPTTERKQPYSK